LTFSGFQTSLDERVDIFGSDTVALRAEVDHREFPGVDQPVNLALADSKPFGGLCDG